MDLINCSAPGCPHTFFEVEGRPYPDLCMDHAEERMKEEGTWHDYNAKKVAYDYDPEAAQRTCVNCDAKIHIEMGSFGGEVWTDVSDETDDAYFCGGTYNGHMPKSASRKTADDRASEQPVDEDQAGTGESTVTDYDSMTDQDPMWAEDWDGEDDTGSQIGSEVTSEYPGAEGSNVDPEPLDDLMASRKTSLFYPVVNGSISPDGYASREEALSAGHALAREIFPEQASNIDVIDDGEDASFEASRNTIWYEVWAKRANDIQSQIDALYEKANTRPELIAGAEAAYDGQDQGWFDSQSLEDLKFLWEVNPMGMNFSWDDEVYEALFAKGHFASRKTAENAQILNIKKRNGVAGEFAFEVDVQYDDEEPMRVNFYGSDFNDGANGTIIEFGGRSETQTYVSDPYRFGEKLDEQWVRNFFGDARELGSRPSDYTSRKRANSNERCGTCGEDYNEGDCSCSYEGTQVEAIWRAAIKGTQVPDRGRSDLRVSYNQMPHTADQYIVVNTDTEEVLAGPFSDPDEAGEAMNELNPSELGLSGPYYNGFDVPLAVAVDDDRWRTSSKTATPPWMPMVGDRVMVNGKPGKVVETNGARYDVSFDAGYTVKELSRSDLKKAGYKASEYSDMSGACADNDHDSCKLTHPTSSQVNERCLCPADHSFAGENVRFGGETSGADYSGACADGDHGSCKMLHGVDAEWCLCPNSFHGTTGSRKTASEDVVAQAGEGAYITDQYDSGIRHDIPAGTFAVGKVVGITMFGNSYGWKVEGHGEDFSWSLGGNWNRDLTGVEGRKTATNAFGEIDFAALSPQEMAELVKLTFEFRFEDSDRVEYYTIQSIDEDGFVNVTGDDFNGTIGIPARRIKSVTWYGHDYPDVVKNLPDPPTGSRKTAEIDDSTRSFTLNQFDQFGRENENWIGFFTDRAVDEMEAFWLSEEGQGAQPNLPGYADGTLKLIRDEKARRTGSRKKQPIVDIARLKNFRSFIQRNK